MNDRGPAPTGGTGAAFCGRWVLVGDGESPHLLKWARALTASGRVDLWALSSRGFLPGFDGVVPSARRLALQRTVAASGGNADLLLSLPRVARWLRKVDADVLHAHYLTSHGTLALLARQVARLRADLVASAWGSDILVTPLRGPAWRGITRRVLHSALLSTSDSQHMATAMRSLGAAEVMVFPFGLETLPALEAEDGAREPWLFFANRGLEPLYRPERVLDWYAAQAQQHREAFLVVANDGSLRPALEAAVRARGLTDRVRFVGRLDPDTQAAWYRRAQWFVSLPQSDSVSVSVLEAMAHGCIPVLSDLPANREVIEPGETGLIVPEGPLGLPATIEDWLPRAARVAERNRGWIKAQGLFAPAVERFLDRVRSLQGHGPVAV
jgi:L-malate glycosyltransferase